MVRELTWEQYDARKKELYAEQEANLEELKKNIEEYAGKIRGIWKDDDGWMDGFQVYYFAVEDRKGNLIKLKGSDDNKGAYKNGALYIKGFKDE